MLNLKSLLLGGSKESPSSTSEPKKLNQKSKETAQNLVNVINDDSLQTFSKNATDVEILGHVYNMMVKTYNDEKLREELDSNRTEEKEKRSQQRHDEIIEALGSLTFGSVKKPGKIKGGENSSDVSGVVPQMPIKPPTAPKPTAPTAPKPTAPTAPKPTAPTAPKPTATTKPKATAPTKVPKTATQKPSAQKQTAPAAPTQPVTPPKVSGTPPVPMVGKGAAAAAAVSIAGETYATDSLSKKVGQVVGGDPSAGEYSYGMFGMNSKAKTIDQFIQENPQFKFKSKPGTTEFNDEFAKLGVERTQEMYDAQLAWYEKHVYTPTVNKLKKSGLPENVSKNQSVITYMSDRFNQMGSVGESGALRAAAGATTPEEFIDKISQYDMSTIQTSFKTYLSKYEGREREGQIKALEKRVQKRRNLSQQPNTTGSSINSSSLENRDLNESLSAPIMTSSVINQNNYNMYQPQHRQNSTTSSDDRSAYERKIRTA